MTAAKLIVAIVLAVAAGTASAGYTISLQPTLGRSGEPIMVRFDDTDGCFEVEVTEVEKNGEVVQVGVLLSDIVQATCLPRHKTPVLVPLGTFAPGNYGVVVRLCVFFLDVCFDETTLSLGISDSNRRAIIPASSWLSLLLSCGGILALALIARSAAPPQ